MWCGITFALAGKILHALLQSPIARLQSINLLVFLCKASTQRLKPFIASMGSVGHHPAPHGARPRRSL